MTEANRTPDSLEARGYKTVATLVMGPQTYLVMENPTTDIKLDPVTPADQALYFHKQTKLLPPDATVRFEDIDPNKVTIAQIGTGAPTPLWTERVSGTDELTLKFSVTDAKKGQSSVFDLFEPELRDLFIKDPAQPSKANFFRIDTAGGSEIVGLAIKRNFPAMLLLTPGKDGVSHSPAEGLLTFLTQVHGKLMEKPSGLQWRTAERIYAAFIEDEVIFKSAATTPSQKRLQEIQKKIYMIQAALLAREAEDKDGDQDTTLLAHVPFLNDPISGRGASQTKGSILSRMFAAQAPLPIHQKKQVILDNKTWTSLLAKTDKGLIDTPQARLRTSSNSPFQTQSLRPAVQPQRPIAAPAPIAVPVHPRPQQTAAETVILPRPAPAPEKAPNIDEKAEAIKLSADIDAGINEVFHSFKDVDLARLNGVSLIKLQNQLARLSEAAEGYFKVRTKRAPMPQTPTQVTISAVPTAIDLGGIDAKLIFEFLDKNKLPSAREKVAKAFDALENLVTPIYSNTQGRPERKISVITNNKTLMESFPEIRDQLLPAINDLMTKIGKGGEDIYLAELAQHILSLQVLYALQLQYRALRAKGQVGEIDAWISFTKNSIAKLKSLPVN